jgi:hypothetical protein
MNYYKFNDLNIRHGFFYKPYSFNKNLNEEEFNKNIDLVKSEFKLDDVVEVVQKHTNIIKKVTKDNMYEETVADGMITDLENIGLMIKVADCQAILLYDSKNKVIGNIHSGWRGTLSKIVENAINMMVNDYNSNKEDIKVYICPSIMQDHFEVDEDVYLLFKERIDNIHDYVFIKGNKYHIDLQKIVINDLKDIGIDKILDADTCTYCNHDIYQSYRYNKTDKRNYLVAYIEE